MVIDRTDGRRIVLASAPPTADAADRAERHNARGIELFRDGQAAEASEAFRAAIAAVDDARYRTNLCAALCVLGDHAGAAEHGGEAVRLDPRSDDAWHYLGVALDGYGHRVAAAAARREAAWLRRTGAGTP